jgi:hypothetical protein
MRPNPNAIYRHGENNTYQKSNGQIRVFHRSY